MKIFILLIIFFEVIKIKKLIIFLTLLFSTFTIFTCLAYELDKDDKIYVGGEAIGIKLNTGVTVIGSYGILENGNVYKPWYDAGIKDGDKIVSMNNTKVTDIKSLLNILYIVKDNQTDIRLIRNEETINTSIRPVLSKNNYSLGLYVKDSVLGVGTLTYYIEEANIYGSLGHKITDEEYYGGSIYEAKVNKIIKPTANRAGEKQATIDSTPIGSISKNTITGVHGTTNKNFDTSNMKLMEFKTKEEISLGEAEIWTCINGQKIESYDINITSLEKQKTKDIKGISFEVVDQDLLNKTGGIIQGMSGSPIIQDDKIIGAVTHVLLSDSKKGYGIYLEFMFEDMGITIKK